MIRRYGPEDEQRVLVAGHVRDWARAGLLTAEQARTIERRLQTGLRRTNVFLRGALALFTAVVVAAATALVFVSFGITRAAPTALTLAAGAIACIACAEYLIGAFHVHRHGVEEALVGGAIVLVSLATRRMADAATMPEQDAIVSGVAAVAAAAAYGRYGFVYCAVAAMACAAGIPLALDWSSTLRLSIAAAICAATVAVARAARRDEDEVRAGDWTLVQAAAVAGMYLFINVRLFDVVGPAGARSVAAWFYWTTYVLTWAIPAAGLLAGLRDRDRPLLTMSVALACATLATNKPYLGLARESWDPILFGALLVAVATAVRRWLARGPNGERSGFTAQKILERDRDWLRSVATASVAWPPHDITARPSEPPPSQFEGGRSGGGGGGATY